MKGLPWIIDCDSDPRDIHVMPLEDLRPHTATIDCWCRPEREDRALPCRDGSSEDTEVLVHNAMDRRDQYTPDGGPLSLH